MVRQNNIIIAGSGSRVMLDRVTLRQIRGVCWARVDIRFFIIALLSVLFHVVLIFYIGKLKLKPVEEMVIEQVPERFAKLIIEKPIPKIPPQSTVKTGSETPEKSTSSKPEEKRSGSGVSSIERTQAQKSVQVRTDKVEQKVRTVGVLGMLTGVGSTAKGPSVVDVLGTIGDKKDKFKDLDAALESMAGLKKTQTTDVLNKKLVKSKDVSISHKEEIDNLIANVGQAKTMDLAKKGDLVIQRPESIEGAASSNAKRESEAINAVVSSHKTSIRMSYEKYLRRDPSLAGKITIRITIAASGSVTMVKVVENTTGNSELEQEIMRKVRMWQFEPITDGEVTVSYPFVFMPAS